MERGPRHCVLIRRTIPPVGTLRKFNSNNPAPAQLRGTSPRSKRGVHYGRGEDAVGASGRLRREAERMTYSGDLGQQDPREQWPPQYQQPQQWEQGQQGGPWHPRAYDPGAHQHRIGGQRRAGPGPPPPAAALPAAGPAVATAGIPALARDLRGWQQPGYGQQPPVPPQQRAEAEALARPAQDALRTYLSRRRDRYHRRRRIRLERIRRRQPRTAPPRRPALHPRGTAAPSSVAAAPSSAAAGHRHPPRPARLRARPLLPLARR